MTESEAKAYIEYLSESLKHFGAIKFDDKLISEYMDENRRVSDYLLALKRKRGEPEENDNGSEPTLIKTLMSFMKFMDTLNKYLIKVEGLDAEVIKNIEPDSALDRYVKGMGARVAMAKAPSPEPKEEKAPEKEETASFGNFWDTKKTIDEKKAEEARREAEEEKAESEKVNLALSRPMGGRRKSGWSVGGEAVKEPEDEVKKAEPEDGAKKAETEPNDEWKSAETDEVPFSDEPTEPNKKKTDDEDNKPRPRRKTKWER